jgi:hypothetical protein
MFLYVIVYLRKYTPVAYKTRNSCELFNENRWGDVGKRRLAEQLQLLSSRLDRAVPAMRQADQVRRLP